MIRAIGESWVAFIAAFLLLSFVGLIPAVVVYTSGIALTMHRMDRRTSLKGVDSLSLTR